MSSAQKPADKGLVERPVKTVGAKGKVVPATLRVREWKQEERTTRAIKRLAACWLIALCVVFIPPHLPWLITAFLAGPLLAYLASRESARVHEQQISCPDCGAQVPVEEQPASWPLGARCRQCLNIFSIERVEPT